MKCVILFLLFLFCLNVYAQKDSTRWDLNKYVWSHAQNAQKKAQKPAIDFDAIDNWPSIDKNAVFSNNGEYFVYTYSKGNYRNKTYTTLKVMSTKSNWDIEFKLASSRTPFFSRDNKKLAFLNQDTLCLLYLGTDRIEKIPGVTELKTPEKFDGEWIAYRLKNENSTFIIHNLINERKQKYDSIESFSVSENGKIILLKGISSNGKDQVYFLSWLKLPDFKKTNIWVAKSNLSMEQVIGFNIDEEKLQVAFMIKQDSFINHQLSKSENSIWYFREGMENAILKVNNNSPGIESGLSIGSYPPEISMDKEFILFKLQPTLFRKKDESVAQVDVWSYKDTILQTKQLSMASFVQTYYAAVAINKQNVIKLTKENEQISSYSKKTGDVVISLDINGDRQWGRKPNTNWLVSLSDGKRITLPSGSNDYYFSPGGNYLLYYNRSDYNYYSYNLLTGFKANLTAQIPSTTFAHDDSGIISGLPNLLDKVAVGIAGWLKDDASVLVYGNYDLWKLDLSGSKPAVNVTEGYGTKNKIKLRLLDRTASVFNGNETVLLTAFNINNKYNGFYEKSLNKTGKPELLTMGPYTYYYGYNTLPLSANNFDNGYRPIKAKKEDIWVVGRQSATESFNYYISSDLKSYKPLTNFQPQREYNWLTAELISWKQLDGTITQGILYKPESLDTNKKYPVIINYYEKYSHRLHQFPQPGFTAENINIPWFVSRGYLVLTPDIIFRNSEVGGSALNTVVSAAQMLSKMSFVDSNKIAINGHSVGGWLTNYIITHTNIFAAALESAGMTDNVSAALQLGGGNWSIPRIVTSERNNGGNTIWEKPELYMERNPILMANKITSPLLIMHNKADGSVPWPQAIELFIALWRLEKPAWMLQYDNSGHVLSSGNDTKDAEDYSIRITQFFDHFLKNAPAPKWMTQGVPAKLKQIETRFELDSFGQCHNNCKVCKQINELALGN